MQRLCQQKYTIKLAFVTNGNNTKFPNEQSSWIV